MSFDQDPNEAVTMAVFDPAQLKGERDGLLLALRAICGRATALRLLGRNVTATAYHEVMHATEVIAKKAIVDHGPVSASDGEDFVAWLTSADAGKPTAEKAGGLTITDPQIRTLAVVAGGFQDDDTGDWSFTDRGMLKLVRDAMLADSRTAADAGGLSHPLDAFLTEQEKTLHQVIENLQSKLIEMQKSRHQWKLIAETEAKARLIDRLSAVMAGGQAVEQSPYEAITLANLRAGKLSAARVYVGYCEISEELKAANGAIKRYEAQAEGLRRAAMGAGALSPTLYQYRTRPDWHNDDHKKWSEWENCTPEQAADYLKTHILHDWHYEVRALYARPTASGAVRLLNSSMITDLAHRHGFAKTSMPDQTGHSYFTFTVKEIHAFARAVEAATKGGAA